jgi:hypothetical protein
MDYGVVSCYNCRDLQSDPSTVSCEHVLADGSTLESVKPPCSNATAEKMRAALLYSFGKSHNRGSAKWEETLHGAWVGNPVLSNAVSNYMISLKRRKVCDLVSSERSSHRAHNLPRLDKATRPLRRKRHTP